MAKGQGEPPKVASELTVDALTEVYLDLGFAKDFGWTHGEEDRYTRGELFDMWVEKFGQIDQP